MNGIWRQTSIGIAIEDEYGIESENQIFALYANEYSIEEVVNIVENQANIGSVYESNQVNTATRACNVNMSVKINEDVLPLFLLQGYDIETETVDGASQHTLTLNQDTEGYSYTLFHKDPIRGDLIIKGFKWESLTLMFQPMGFVVAEIAGVGRYPEEGVTTLEFDTAIEFLGRHVTYQYGDTGGSLSPYKLLTAEILFSNPLSGDDQRYVLGSEDIDNLYMLQRRIESTIKTRLDSNDNKDDWVASTAKASTILIEDTTREIGTNHPQIEISLPSQKIIEWTRESSPNEIVNQEMKLLALDNDGSPAQIVITNSIESYLTVGS